jgi:hypothetical protein
MTTTIHCPDRQQVRVIVKNSSGNELFRKTTGFAPILETVTELPQIWIGRPRILWGNPPRWGTWWSPYTFACPVTLQTRERSNGYKYLEIVDANGVLWAGYWAAISGGGDAPYKPKNDPAVPVVVAYDPPGNPDKTFETTLVDSSGNQIWRGLQTLFPVTVEAECACKTDELQCGEMGEYEEQDGFCCMDCGVLELNILLARKQVENLNGRLE